METNNKFEKKIYKHIISHARLEAVIAITLQLYYMSTI